MGLDLEEVFVTGGRLFTIVSGGIRPNFACRRKVTPAIAPIRGTLPTWIRIITPGTGSTTIPDRIVVGITQGMNVRRPRIDRNPH